MWNLDFIVAKLTIKIVVMLYKNQIILTRGE